jgi:hypothetical protein
MRKCRELFGQLKPREINQLYTTLKLLSRCDDMVDMPDIRNLF